ncbi:MAG TPA: hypothetical protein VH079_17755 [Terriglobales bacterium]|jgi:hypothetical protein|nr:hypothetical protein [Terriglobales bacterium]
MEIYDGILMLKKTTQQMTVYGNEELRTQYVPKSFFPKRKSFPESVRFSITTADTPKAEFPIKSESETNGDNSRKKGRKAGLQIGNRHQVTSDLPQTTDKAR